MSNGNDEQDDDLAAGKDGAGKLTKKALVDAVAATTGQKKPSVKEAVDAVLAELSAALSRGETLVLPPLGRVSVARTKSNERSQITVLKLRHSKAEAGASSPGGADED